MSELKAGPNPGAIQVNDQKYSAELTSDPGGRPVVRFRGTISSPNPSATLDRFVDSVHERVVRSGAPSVVVDFRELEFCNSSGFRSFLHWVERIREVRDVGGYRLEFVLSAKRMWQRSSVLALSCFAPEQVRLQ